jgi:hypothetical protein
VEQFKRKEETKEEKFECDLVQQQDQLLLVDNEEEIEDPLMSHSYYAIKQVRNDLPSLSRLDAITSLDNEMKILSSLCHSNVIKIQ